MPGRDPTGAEARQEHLALATQYVFDTYSFPTFTWWPEDQLYELLAGADGGKLALFRPRASGGASTIDAGPFLGAQKMADEISVEPNLGQGRSLGVYLT